MALDSGRHRGQLGLLGDVTVPATDRSTTPTSTPRTRCTCSRARTSA